MRNLEQWLLVTTIVPLSQLAHTASSDALPTLEREGVVAISVPLPYLLTVHARSFPNFVPFSAVSAKHFNAEEAVASHRLRGTKNLSIITAYGSASSSITTDGSLPSTPCVMHAPYYDTVVRRDIATARKQK
jgi:hypothetical protein